jgi:hypothetical protein
VVTTKRRLRRSFLTLKKMIDFGWIHNGLPSRVHAWFDVDPEESPGRREMLLPI